MACLHCRMVHSGCLLTVSHITYLAGWFSVVFPVVFTFLGVLLLWQVLHNSKGFPRTSLSLASSQLLMHILHARPAKCYQVTCSQSQHVNRQVCELTHCSFSFSLTAYPLSVSSTLRLPLPSSVICHTGICMWLRSEGIGQGHQTSPPTSCKARLCSYRQEYKAAERTIRWIHI